MDAPYSYYKCPRCGNRVCEPDPCECEEISDEQLDDAQQAINAAEEANWEGDE